MQPRNRSSAPHQLAKSSQKDPPLSSPAKCTHQGPGRPEPKRAQPGTHPGRRRVHILTIQNQRNPAGSQSSDTTRQNPNAAKIPGLLSIQAKHEQCGALLTTEQQVKAIPAVIFNGAVVERYNHLRYLGVHYHRMLTYRQHVESTNNADVQGTSVSPEGLPTVLNNGISSSCIRV